MTACASDTVTAPKSRFSCSMYLFVDRPFVRDDQAKAVVWRERVGGHSDHIWKQITSVWTKQYWLGE